MRLTFSSAPLVFGSGSPCGPSGAPDPVRTARNFVTFASECVAHERFFVRARFFPKALSTDSCLQQVGVSSSRSEGSTSSCPVSEIRCSFFPLSGCRFFFFGSRRLFWRGFTERWTSAPICCFFVKFASRVQRRTHSSLPVPVLEL